MGEDVWSHILYALLLKKSFINDLPLNVYMASPICSDT